MGGGCSDEKVTTMVLKVDLDCSQCYKKVKRLLCKYPQIRDQLYDEKNNTVTITVVCCSPERIRDKLRSKGGKTIKSIEIKEPKKPQAQPQGQTDGKPKKAEDGKPTKAPPSGGGGGGGGDGGDKPKSKAGGAPEAGAGGGHKQPQQQQKPAGDNPQKPSKQQDSLPPAAPAAGGGGGGGGGGNQAGVQKMMAYGPGPEAQWVPGYPSVGGPMMFQPPPPTMSYSDQYGPVAYYGRPMAAAAPPPYYQHGSSYGYGYGHGHPHGNPHCDYLSEENPGACSIM